jgi:hypothetical protein
MRQYDRYSHFGHDRQIEIGLRIAATAGSGVRTLWKSRSSASKILTVFLRTLAARSAEDL